MRVQLDPQRCYYEVIDNDTVLQLFSASNVCNLDCLVCPEKFRTNVITIPIDQLKRKLKEASLLKVKYVFITGYEPLLNPDILTIIDLVENANLPIVIDTNGLYLGRIKQLRDRVEGFNIDIKIPLSKSNPIYDRVIGSNHIVYQDRLRKSLDYVSKNKRSLDSLTLAKSYLLTSDDIDQMRKDVESYNIPIKEVTIKPLEVILND